MTLRVSPRGRRARLTVSAVAVTLLVLSALLGSDDHFPFTPMRMYSSRPDPDGVVLSSHFEAVTEEGRHVRVLDRHTGMRRAEMEGQLDRFVADPSLLRHVAEAHRRRHPEQPRYVEVWVVQRRHQLRDSRVVDRQESVLAVWRQP